MVPARVPAASFPSSLPGGSWPTRRRARGPSAGADRGDGDQDLASANVFTENLTVFFQTTPGRFDSQPLVLANLPLFDRPFSVALGDLDRDGDQDIVSANELSLTAFLQETRGTIRSTPVVLESPFFSGFVALDDLDMDGHLDLISADNTFGGLAIFFQQELVSFGVPFVLATADDSVSVALGDIDGDGDKDLVCANNSQDNLSVYLHESPATFGSPPFTLGGVSTHVIFSRPISVALGDLDGDGDPDLISTNANSNNLMLFFQETPGTFPFPPLELGGGPDTDGARSVALGDFDEDGDQDFVSANASGDDLTIFFQEAPGSFPAPPLRLSRLGMDAPASVALGDVDGDGDLDLGSANADRDNLTLFFQDPPGSFSSTPLELGDLSSMDSPVSVTIGDLDGDGDQDIVSANPASDNLTVFFQELPGLFPSPPLVLGALPTTDGPRSVALGDLDGDGDNDLVSANREGPLSPAEGDNLTIFFQEAPGTFRSPPAVLESLLASFVTIGDLDGDGDHDLVSGDALIGRLTVFWGGR
jgi:hypothetical protein